MYGQVSTGQEQEFDYGIKNNSTQTVTTPTYLGTVGADGTYGKILLADLQGKKAFLSTGLIKNGLISANGDPTKFNITAGIGIISNFDDPENPTSTIINFPAFTGITPTYLLTGTITYVAINNAAALIMQATPFTPEQRRSLIILGAVIHSNLTTINLLNNISAPSNASTNQLHDFIEAVGALNLTGNKYTANGANLQLDKSAGLIFKLGSNFANDWKNPHELAQTAGTSLTFRYRTQNGTEGSDRINLDPALYDLSNVLTAVPNNKFTIQTVTMFQSGVTRIQYGQNVYDDLATAKNAVFTRNFVLEPNSKENGIIRAYIIMRNTTTSLQNVADADILEAQKFGGIASGGVALTLANIVTALGYTPENVANKQNSLVIDGTGVKYATVDAINNGVILKDATPQTKIGSLTLGENLTHTNDNWLAFGTSITFQGNYTAPMSKTLGITLTNYGVSSSTSNNLVTQYSLIPNIVGIENSYRLISVEHGVNDAQLGVSLATFRTNIENFILEAKSKGWANNKILVINCNYSSFFLIQEAYANEAILIAKEQGVQYVDIYNYTKNNGGLTLLSDGLHPNVEGGKVYARGVTSLMNGGIEVSTALNVINGVTTGSDVRINNLTLGKGFSNIASNTVLGLESLSANTVGAEVVANGYQVGKANTTGSGWTAMGYQAGLSNTTGSFWTANGYKAGLLNTTGGSWVASGYQAGQANTTGSNWVANGYQAGLVNTTGGSWTASGYQAGKASTTGSNWTATGNGAGSFNTTGNSWVANGFQAGWLNTTGGSWIAMGFRAGAYIANGSTSLLTLNNGVFLGASTKALADNSTNEIVIGFDAIGAGSNTATLGNTSITSTVLRGAVTAGTSIVSPNLTGNPTAPTATLGDNDTSIATTAFVQSTTNANAILTTTNQTKTGQLIVTPATTSLIALQGNSTSSVGVYGTSVSDVGVYGTGTVGVQGVSVGSVGVQGNSTSGFGVRGDSSNSYGVYGNSTSGRGIIGVSSSAEGVFAQSSTSTALSAQTITGTKIASFLLGAVEKSSVLAGGEVTGLSFKPFVYTVATLPSPPITGTGTYATVSDALAPSYMVTVVGGGAVVTPVFYNGTNWVAH